jgi:hypothetical protein
MARFIIARSVKIPAGTAKTTPASTDISIPQYVVSRIIVTIPPGPNGLMGFRLANASVQVIPYGSNDWIIGNNRIVEWDLEEQITSGSWQVIGYNTGTYDHSIQLEFNVSPVPVPGPAGVTVSAADLSTATLLDTGAGGSGAPEQPPAEAESPAAALPPLVAVNIAPPPSPGLVPPPPGLPL